MITLKEAAQLEEVVKRIIEIDEQAENYRSRNAKAREAEAEQLQAELKGIKAEFEGRLSREKKGILEETMRKAEEEAVNTAAMRQETLGRLKAAYEAGSQEVAENLFRELIEKMKEG